MTMTMQDDDEAEEDATAQLPVLSWRRASATRHTICWNIRTTNCELQQNKAKLEEHKDQWVDYRRCLA